MRLLHLIPSALILSAGIMTAMAAEWTGQVGLQLQSVHIVMSKDLDGTLGKVHDFGFKYVELVGEYSLSADSLTAELTNHQLTAISAHFPYARFRDDPEGIANEATKLGLKMVGCPSLPQKDKLDLAGCDEAIKIFNRAGEILAQHHIQFFYHPHGYEFQPSGDGTFFDVLAAKTDPQFVHFQMDVFWIVHAGQDPLKLFHKYGNRWISMHLKDMKKGTPTGLFTGHSPASTFVPVGQGQIDIPAVVQAAHEVGVKWFFLEDESEKPDLQIPQSVSYFKTMKW